MLSGDAEDPPRAGLAITAVNGDCLGVCVPALGAAGGRAKG